MPLDEPHPIWPEGPDCDEQCPGKWSQYHDGFAWGVENERARIRAAVDGLNPQQDGDIVTLNGTHRRPVTPADYVELYRAAVLAIIDREDTDARP